MTFDKDPVDRGTRHVADSGESAWTSDERDWARRRVERKHKLRADVVAYVVVNLFLVGVWAVTGLGYFWPGWVIAGWGVLLLLDAITIYTHHPVTGAEIEHELRSRN